MDLAFDNIAKAHLETGEAMKLGATDAELKEIRTLIRHSQWKADMAIAGHGAFFHAPEEVLRLLGSANEQAQQARIKLVGVLAKHGVMDFVAPEFDTKDKAQKIAKVDMPALIAEKLKFKETLEKEWKKEAAAKGRLAPNSVALDPAVDSKSSYFDKNKK